MAIAQDPSETFEYVLRCDRGLVADVQTIWTLRGLRHKDRVAVEDSVMSTSGDGQFSFRTGSQRTTILLRGIVSVANFKDSRGVPIVAEKANRDRIQESFLDHVHPDHQTELANVIDNGGPLEEPESAAVVTESDGD